jgi:DNA-binding response OmpR family regulator
MQIYPVLLLDRQVERTVELAALLTAAGFPTRVEATASDALQAMSEDFFVAVIVVADLDNRECLARLVDLRRAAVHTWMIVVSPRCDDAWLTRRPHRAAAAAAD